MDCNKLLESVDIFGHVGVCISLERSQLLQNSLIILQQENHFQKCFYWGRINGIENDYYIAFGFQKECLQSKKYFYSTDCLNWLLMPTPDKNSLMKTCYAITDFKGDPSDTVTVYDPNFPYPSNKNIDNYEYVPTELSLKEEDRLSATVYFIDFDAVLIPRGAWLKGKYEKIMENESFSGLDPIDAHSLKSYLHARLPQKKFNSNLLKRKDYNRAYDFLDTIEEDYPKGCWSLQFAQANRLALLYSLYWPGMTFYHKINTPHYGFLYVGNGIKSLDVSFMLL